MLKSNRIGTDLARIKGVNAMTDLAGFGLAGHLAEMCRASGVAARIDFRRLPRLAEAEAYRRKGVLPEATQKNLDALGASLPAMDESHWQWLCDPQTSGGLLLAVHPSWEDDVERVGRDHGMELAPFGEIVAQGGERLIEVKG
jgi:selenide,water dikinase